MEIIRYQLLSKINRGTEEVPVWEDILNCVTMPRTEANEAIARLESVNGDFSIEDDGKREPFAPTTADRLLLIENVIKKLIIMFPTLS